jgi:hypothetical protein
MALAKDYRSLHRNTRKAVVSTKAIALVYFRR